MTTCFRNSSHSLYYPSAFRDGSETNTSALIGFMAKLPLIIASPKAGSTGIRDHLFIVKCDFFCGRGGILFLHVAPPFFSCRDERVLLQAVSSPFYKGRDLRVLPIHPAHALLRTACIWGEVHRPCTRRGRNGFPPPRVQASMQRKRGCWLRPRQRLSKTDRDTCCHPSGLRRNSCQLRTASR